jgi:hypothetical protein
LSSIVPINNVEQCNKRTGYLPCFLVYLSAWPF